MCARDVATNLADSISLTRAVSHSELCAFRSNEIWPFRSAELGSLISRRGRFAPSEREGEKERKRKRKRERERERERSRELTWKALFVAGRQECGGRRDGRRRVPGGHDIRLHPVARRKLQHLLLLLAAPPPAAARRERFHSRQEADPAHVFPARFRDFSSLPSLFLRRLLPTYLLPERDDARRSKSIDARGK